MVSDGPRYKTVNINDQDYGGSLAGLLDKSAIDVDVESKSLLLEDGVTNEGSNCNGVAREDIE